MKRKAFTLIEILIVIFVFGVGILAVLQLLTKSLGFFDNISMKSKASLLATEGMEMIYTIRDSNIEQGYPRNYIEREEEQYLGSGDDFRTFKVGFTGEQAYWDLSPEKKTDNFESNFKTFYLDLFTGNQELAYYHHVSQTELPQKGFARIIEFTPIKAGGEELDTNKILKITSRVLYKRGNSTGEVVLESFIGMKDSLPADK